MLKIDTHDRQATAASSVASGRTVPPFGGGHRFSRYDRQQFEQAIRVNEAASNEPLEAGLTVLGATQDELDDASGFSFDVLEDASLACGGDSWPAGGDVCTLPLDAKVSFESGVSDCCAAIREGLSEGMHCFEISLSRLGSIVVQCNSVVSGAFVLRLTARDARTSRWLAERIDCLQTTLADSGCEHILLAVADATEAVSRR